MGYEIVRAEEIERGDKIKLPSSDAPDVLWYVEELHRSVSLLTGPRRLYTITTREHGTRAEAHLTIAHEEPVHRYSRGSK
ncbi:hypothetical protein [Mycolicibacterium iranicum]|uniref:Uncharacterized protein n=1 Tax=Mycolicibacterium iranicum TaxID=912594 RepID=A0A178LLP9_MYCIR|nr:hypothetical protein [Mycolicibacterium iranicum]OAN32048.1 hypothetical protein A4X20_28640 [Mycolicibacterium iranicum]